MAMVIRARLRIKAGGTIGSDGGMTGGVALGHFMSSASVNINRDTLTRKLSNGPTTQATDPDDDTCTVEVDALRDTVAGRNLLEYAAAGGYVEINEIGNIGTSILERYNPFMFGGAGGTAQKEANTEKVTLVGTNLAREAVWVAAQSDMPGDGQGGG